MHSIRILVVASVLASVPSVARAQNDASATREKARDAKGEIPVAAYTYTAYGAPAKTVGAYGYGLGLAGPRQRATAGGGVTMWGSPVDRLTVVVDALRDVYLLDHFAPSAALVARLLGLPGDGWSMGAIGKYKIEGFGTDPDGNTESEMEGGLLLSFGRRGFHLDLNGVTGFGLTADGEIDVEGRLRVGYDLSSLVRVGLDGQGRWRLAGDLRLPGNRTWDFAAGPQVLVSTGPFFGSITAGPTTMGLTAPSVVGGVAMASVGAVMM
jgi:hypothetical protein